MKSKINLKYQAINKLIEAFRLKISTLEYHKSKVDISCLEYQVFYKINAHVSENR